MSSTSNRTVLPFLNSFTRLSKLSTTSQTTYICQPCRRQLHRSVKALPVPQPTPFVPDVPTFLTLIGRGLSQHASKFENNWDALFSTTSFKLKQLGIEPPRSRKYLLRWLDKFRRGDFGPGGDFEHVTDGKAQLRVVEVPVIQKPTNTSSTASNQIIPSTSSTPGMTRLILNVPADTPRVVSFKSILKSGQSAADLRKPKKYKLVDGHIITGPHAQPIKGIPGAIVEVKEGMWEHKRGQKVHGGERRRAETLHKAAIAENKKNAR